MVKMYGDKLLYTYITWKYSCVAYSLGFLTKTIKEFFSQRS